MYIVSRVREASPFRGVTVPRNVGNFMWNGNAWKPPPPSFFSHPEESLSMSLQHLCFLCQLTSTVLHRQWFVSVHPGPTLLWDAALPLLKSSSRIFLFADWDAENHCAGRGTYPSLCMHGKPNKPPQINSVSSPFVFSPCLSPPSLQFHPSLLWHPFPIFNVPLAQLTFNITRALLSLHHLHSSSFSNGEIGSQRWPSAFWSPQAQDWSFHLVAPPEAREGAGNWQVQHQTLNSSLAVAGPSLFVLLEDKQLSQCN